MKQNIFQGKKAPKELSLNNKLNVIDDDGKTQKYTVGNIETYNDQHYKMA